MAASMKLRDGSAPGGTMVPATDDRTSAKMLMYAINALQRMNAKTWKGHHRLADRVITELQQPSPCELRAWITLAQAKCAHPMLRQNTQLWTTFRPMWPKQWVARSSRLRFPVSMEYT